MCLYILAQTVVLPDRVYQNLSFQNIFGGDFCTESLAHVSV